MSVHRSFQVIACAACLSAAQWAGAQLVVGTTTSVSGVASAYWIDLNAGTARPLWNTASNKKVNGLTADNEGKRLFSNDAARLNVWNYQQIGTVPAFIGGMYRVNPTTGAHIATGVDGLEYVNGELYGWTNFASTIVSDGIYRINTTPDSAGHCVMTPVWETPDDSFDFEGLAYNPADGCFYGTHSQTTSANPVGLYKIDVFGTGAATLVASYPSGRTNVTGLAIGGGYAWMTEFVNAPANADDTLYIYQLDLATNTYTDTLALNIPSTANIASGVAWTGSAQVVPEAGITTGLLPAALLLGSRRRR